MQGPDYPSTLPYPWVVSDGTIITPAGTQVYLGTTTRAKAIALNPNTRTHTAAVLQMGAPQAVTIFNTQTGAVLQNFKYGTSKTGSATGIAYTSDGLHLLFSQDSGYVAYVNVDPGTGMITSNVARISVPLDATTVNFPGFGPEPVLNSANCTQTVTMPGTGVTISSPVGTSGSYAIPCGIPETGSYLLGLAVSPDNSTAYVVADGNDELAKINLNTQTLVSQLRVGNVPHSVVVSRGRQNRLRLQRGWPDCYPERLPALLRRHQCRRRISDRHHGSRHHFRGQSVHIYGHRQHRDRPPPDRHGLLGQVPVGRQCL